MCLLFIREKKQRNMLALKNRPTYEKMPTCFDDHLAALHATRLAVGQTRWDASWQSDTCT